MKRLIVLISAIVLVLVGAGPALAQQGATPDQYSNQGNGANQAGGEVTLTGVVEKPEATTYQYGTHAISDDDSGFYALQSDTVDLDAYVGQSVTVYGTLVAGYENGQIEGGPPLVEVTQVEPLENPDAYSVTLSFELAVEGQPPAGTSFFGFIPAEGGISARLTDPDGDGLYTSSTDVPQYPPGPRPVPEGVEPVTLPIQIVQATEVKYGFPLYPTIIKDFGNVLMDEDKTFSASVSFEGTTVPGTGDPTDPGNAPDSGGSADSPDDIDVLPDTGGVTLTIMGVALFAAAGLSFTVLLSTGMLRRR